MKQNILWAPIIVSILWMTCVAKPTVESNEDEKENLIPEDADIEFLNSYANKMKSYMNLSISPCDDFYEYACGNWKNVQPDRRGLHIRGSASDIIYTLGDVTENLLTKSSLAIDLNYEKEMQIAQKFYNACLRAELQPLPATDPAYLTLIKSIGGFPAVDGPEWQADKFNWFNMSAHLTNYGAKGLINERLMTVAPFAPIFLKPELGFEYKVYSDNLVTNETEAYKVNEQRMRVYLQSFGLAEEKISEVIAGVFAFWHDVLNLNDRFPEDLTECTQKSYLRKYTQFKHWSNYFEIAWNGENFTLDKPFACDPYYYELDKLCIKHGPSVANYLVMKLLYTMDADFKEVKYQRDYCKGSILASMPHLLGKLYFLEYSIEDTSKEIQSIYNELRKSFRVAIENADFLDTRTRKEALKKESLIKSNIGCQQDDAFTHLLIREMRNLSFVDGSYAQNQINLKRFKVYIDRFNGHHNEELPEETVPSEALICMQSDAFYYFGDNSINVLSGSFHPPFFHKYWPYSLKFGAMGYVIGHELNHGFDTVGSMFDSEAEVREWWSNESGIAYKDRTECFVNHFNNYLIPEINRTINGEKTKNENIADNGGLRQSLSAYRNFIKNKINMPKSEQMPGMDHSPEQLFFLGFAQFFCSAYKMTDYWNELSDEHPTNKFRVIGALRNNGDFSTAYNCPLGSPMNPKTEKCHIW
ncbi:endothelin-converting enzyme 1-like [Drosophila willistoni]|uniref:endothelin-converting enzyme 1-like n=1 Tax=Drosophila willistoni TaxID=7260 RepID=UPI000C26C69C|nr:endothelin-converting enzyme 1-like [Drosophila willistoni]